MGDIYTCLMQDVGTFNYVASSCFRDLLLREGNRVMIIPERNPSNNTR